MNVDANFKQIERASTTRHRVFGALAAAATAVSSAGPATAQTAAQGPDAATPHGLSLNQGLKCASDDALRNGMDRIRGVVEPRLGDAHAGRLTATQHREPAMQIETEVGGIVANGKLDSKADAMAGNNAKLPAVKGLAKVALAVNECGSHFSHPGFKPFRGLNRSLHVPRREAQTQAS